MTRSYELLEHTADVGILARGDTREEAFAAAGEGLAEILGSWFPGRGEEHEVRIEGPDVEALLVAWLDELLYLSEASDAVFGGFEVDRVEETRLLARVRVAPRAGRALEGQHVKAATYHRLRVAQEPPGWTARVFLDV
ncbi:MAG TPA: archease [Actinomycetota bacterium]